MPRKISVDIVVNDKNVAKKFDSAARSAKNFNSDISKASRGALSAAVSFNGLGRALTFSSAQFLGGAGIVFAIKSASEAASNLAEQTTKTQQVFGPASRAVENFAKNALGLASDQALETASSIGALLRPLGLTGKQAADLSIRLTNLGTDFASFFNTDTADALQAIRSGLVGEVEPLRRYGVLLSEARVQQEALRETGKKHVQSLTAQEKVQARVALIFRDSAQAQGDFARTSGGLANTQRDLAKNVRNLEIAVGTALNPTILEVTKRLNNWLANSENQARVQRDVTQAVSAAKSVVKDFAAVIKAVDSVTGNFKNTLKLLIGLKVASTLRSWTKALVGLEIAAGAGGAGGKASTLGAKLAQIARIGVLSVGFRFPRLAAGLSQVTKLGSLLRFLTSARFVVAVTVAVGGLKLIDKLSEKLNGLGIVDTLKGSPFQKGAALNFILGNGFQSDAQRAAKKRVAEEVAIWKKAIADGVKNISQTNELNPRAGVPGSPTFAAESAAAAAAAVRRKGLTGTQRNAFFDNAIARILQRGGLGTIQQQIAALQKANSLIAARLAATKDITRRLNLEDELLQNVAQIKSLNAQQAADALQVRQDTVDKFISGLQLRLTKAQATAPFGDDIAALKALQAGIKAEIREFGNTTELEGQLFDAQQQLSQARTAQITTRQFRQLGLSATGDAVTPGVANLKKQVASLTGRISGTGLDTPKLRNELARFRKVLSEGLVPQDVRGKIRDMLADIRSQLKEHSAFLPRFARTNQAALLKGIGLDPAQIKELRGRLSQVVVGGTVPAHRPAGAAVGPGGTIVVHTAVKLDKDVVGRAVTRHEQRRKQRNPDQRRGVRGGG